MKNKNNRFYRYKINVMSALKINAGILLAFVCLFVLACVLSSKFLSFDNQMNVLRTITTNALCAFGMTFVILTGGIDLSVGSFMSLAGCLTTVLVAWFQVPAVLAVLLSLSAGTLFGAMNGFIITKMKMPPFIVTLATMNIIRGISYIITGGRPVLISDELFQKIGGGFIGKIPISAVYMIIAFLIMWVLLNKTKFGRHVYATGDNLTAAEYSGINTDRTIFCVYILSGLLSAFAGIILSSRLNSGQPIIGQGAELDAIASCIVGGISVTGGSGTLFGTLVGCMIMGTISNLLNLVGVDSFVQLVVKGIIIIAAVYVDTMRKQKI